MLLYIFPFISLFFNPTVKSLLKRVLLIVKKEIRVFILKVNEIIYYKVKLKRFNLNP